MVEIHFHMKVFIFLLLLLPILTVMAGASPPLTLEEAILLGLEKDPYLVEARAKIHELKCDLSQGEFPFTWSWNSDIIAMNLRFDREGFKFVPLEVMVSGEMAWGDDITISGGPSLRIAYSKPLLPGPDYSRDKLELLSKEIQLKKAEIDLENNEREKILNITKEYIRLLNLEENLLRVEEDMERIDLLNQDISIKYELGYASRLDILSAQILSKEVLMSRTRSLTQYEGQKADFLDSLELSQAQLVDVRENIEATLPTLEDAIFQALKKSQLLKELTLDIGYEEALLKAMKQDGLKVRLEGDYWPIEGEGGIYIRGSYAVDNKRGYQKEIEDKVKAIAYLKKKRDEQEQRIRREMAGAFRELEGILEEMDVHKLKIERSDMEMAAAGERFKHGLISAIEMEQVRTSHGTILKEGADLKLAAEMKKLEILSACGIDLLDLVR